MLKYPVQVIPSNTSKVRLKKVEVKIISTLKGHSFRMPLIYLPADEKKNYYFPDLNLGIRV